MNGKHTAAFFLTAALARSPCARSHKVQMFTRGRVFPVATYALMLVGCATPLPKTPSEFAAHWKMIRVGMSAEQERTLYALRNAGNVKPDDETNIIKTKDPQMLRAIDALKGVMIYAQQSAPKAQAVKK